MPHEKPPPYRTYLVRCWQEREAALGEESHWRFWLEEISHKQRKKGFGNLEALFAFLRTELARDEGESS
jgi:hypothetical protein